jgi:hypothetical protein
MWINCPERGFIETKALIKERLFGKFGSNDKDLAICFRVSKVELEAVDFNGNAVNKSKTVNTSFGPILITSP